MTRLALLAWPAEPQHDQTDCAWRSIWTSLCGRYRIVYCEFKLAALAPVYYAEIRDDALGRPCWSVIGRALSDRQHLSKRAVNGRYRYHTAKAARKAAEDHARKEARSCRP